MEVVVSILSRGRIVVFVVVPALCVVSQADARNPRVEPSVSRALATGIVGPRSVSLGLANKNHVPVVVELTSPATPAAIDDLVQRGARLRLIDGKPVFYDRFVPLTLGPSAVNSVLASAHVRRIRSGPTHPLLLPLDHSAELIGLEGARGARPALDRLTGKGMLVADLDSNADVFHPQFFHADAGWFDWIDVNANGVFEPGIDAIDLDGDGIVGASETASWLKARTLSLHWGDEVPARDDVFDPAIDWVYFDENGNQQRDYGVDQGFDDSTPAFGEPIFVPDDVNRNGKIDVGERFVRLGTSKFKKVYVHIEHYAQVDHVFTRGQDLSSLQQDYTGGVYGYSDAMHASGVLSIIAADVPLVGRRWVGMAPEADLLLGFEIAQDSAKSVTWALGEKPDVMLHELSVWTGEPLDGSDPYSTMVDASVHNDHVTHTCPTGNLGGSRKHAWLTISPGQTIVADLDVPSINATYVQTTFNVRGESNASIVLEEPNGTSHDLVTGPSYTNLSTGALMYVGHTASSRGTYYWDALLYEHQAGKSIPTGAWKARIKNNGAAVMTVDAYCFDEVSGWGLGVAWHPSIATDASTAGIPSVSDHCIAVGAHTGHPMSSSTPWFNTPGEVGAVRDYSGRGPRIDGTQKPDVLAPDNPWAAAPNAAAFGGNIIPHGAVWPFGGTSGATPHVTGVTALMAQAGVRGLDARQALRDSAIADSTTGEVPNFDYGWGRMDAAGALGALAAGKPPEVQLFASSLSVAIDEPVTLTVSAVDPDGPSDQLEAKWDDGYDGSWDVPYAPIAPRTLSFDTPGHYPTKVRVRDVQGRIDEAVVWIEVVESTHEPDAGADAQPAEGGETETGAGGSSGNTGGSPSHPSSSSDDDDGCGCRVIASRDSAKHEYGWLVALAVFAARRRSSRG